MSFQPQNLLEQSLMRATSDPAHRPQFYRDLVACNIYIIQPLPQPGESGHRTFQRGEAIQIQTIDWNGKQAIPAFSSLELLRQAVTVEVGYIEANALDFMKGIGGTDLILNPGAACGKEFTASEIQSIIDGSIWNRDLRGLRRLFNYERRCLEIEINLRFRPQ